MNSRNKGKAGEREAVKAIAQHLGIDTRRTAQVDGGLSADIIGWDGVHIEVKRRKRIAALEFLRQAERDTGGGVPIAVMREDGDTEWAVMVRLADLPALCERYAAIEGKPVYPSKGDA
jgi:Holliday junction resolvase